ncbi:hypothetical protein ABBQ38_009455 [Trebouxia sp. C0009 RCD-2024]
MPSFRPQLHRCLGGHICCNAAVFRSSNRPPCVAVAGRHLHYRIAATSASSNGSNSSGQGFGKPSINQQKKQKPEVSSTADALLRSLGEVSSSAGRDVGSTSTNMVLGANDSEAKWRELDEKVNQYPGRRDFKAIGSGGDDFKQAIVRAVENIVGPVHQDRVMERPSSQGKFISITLRDIKVQNPDQVLAVYAAMRKDKRLRYYL